MGAMHQGGAIGREARRGDERPHDVTQHTVVLFESFARLLQAWWLWSYCVFFRRPTETSAILIASPGPASFMRIDVGKTLHLGAAAMERARFRYASRLRK